MSWASCGRTRAAQCISSSVTEAPLGYSRTQSNSEVSGTTYLSGTQPYLSPSIPMKRWHFEASSKHNSKVLYKGNDAHILKWIKTVINLFICGLFCDKYCKIIRQILIKLYLLVTCSLFFCNTPSQVNFIDVDEVFCSHGPQLWKDKSSQQVTLTVHVPECRGYEHTYCPPSVNKKHIYKMSRDRKKNPIKSIYSYHLVEENHLPWCPGHYANWLFWCWSKHRFLAHGQRYIWHGFQVVRLVNLVDVHQLPTVSLALL